MLLAIDIGNTNIVLGVFEGNALGRSWRLATARERTADELGLMVSDLLERGKVAQSSIDGVVLASVVPQLTGPMMEMSTRYLGLTPLNVEAGMDLGMPNLYAHPTEVGADRLVNGIAAYETFGRGRGEPLIVLDFGTATTFDAISAAGEYLGGVICPGIQISADALFQRAARLPRIDVRKPASVIGRTTVTSMQSGLFFGYVGHGRRAGAPAARGTRREGVLRRHRRPRRGDRPGDRRRRRRRSRPHAAGAEDGVGAEPEVEARGQKA